MVCARGQASQNHVQAEDEPVIGLGASVGAVGLFLDGVAVEVVGRTSAARSAAVASIPARLRSPRSGVR